MDKTGSEEAYLNDEVVNCYFYLLLQRSLPKKCHFFSSFFAATLFLDRKAYNYANVESWTRPERLKNVGQTETTVLACDTLYFPVCWGKHWVLIVVDLGAGVVTLLDSNRTPGAPLQDEEAFYQTMKAISQWVHDEGLTRASTEVWDKRIHSGWRYEVVDVPRQPNFWDCGVYMLMNAEYHSANRRLDYDEVAFPTTLRRRIKLNLLHKTVVPRPTLGIPLPGQVILISPFCFE